MLEIVLDAGMYQGTQRRCSQAKEPPSPQEAPLSSSSKHSEATEERDRCIRGGMQTGSDLTGSLWQTSPKIPEAKKGKGSPGSILEGSKRGMLMTRLKKSVMLRANQGEERLGENEEAVRMLGGKSVMEGRGPEALQRGSEAREAC